MTASDRLTNWLAQLRASGPASLLSRLVIAVAGTVALVVPTVQSWDQVDLIPLLGVPLLLVCLVLPDSTAAALFLIVVTAGWIMRAPSDLTFSLVVTAIALLAVHLASAFAAQIPSYGQVSRRALRRWLLPAMIALLLGPVVAVAAAVIRGADVSGSLVVTVAALAAATAAVWFAAGQSVSGG